eukprot:NODE_194_length_15414_cov_0.324127.p2 type:complete len:442 gc:universal NODE_194_length_15414_cov_0.324127:6178-4853(-)
MSTWIESVTQLLAKVLTDKETEHVINRLTSIQRNLKKQSSGDLSVRCHHHEMSCNIHAIRGLSRTFVISFLVKHVIYVLPLLRKSIYNIFSFKWDTVKFAMFLSSYVSLYRIFMCNVSHYTNLKPRAFVAGAIAGSSILLDTNTKRRNGIVWFVCARSLYSAVKLLIFKLQVKEEPSTFELFDSPPTTPIPKSNSKDNFIEFCNTHGNIFFMACSCSVILYNIVFSPLKLPKSYRNFLFYICGIQDRFQHDGIKMMNLISSNVIQNNKLENCQVMHPNISCESHYPIYFLNVFLRCMKIYSPLSLATTIIFKFHTLRKHPKYALKFSFTSAIRSSLFLSALSTTTFGSLCFFRRFRNTESKIHYMLNGFLAGCCIIIEPYGRRTELALYMLPRTLETIFPSISKLTEFILFCISTGTMMHVYEVDHALMGAQGKLMMRIFK